MKTFNVKIFSFQHYNGIGWKNLPYRKVRENLSRLDSSDVIVVEDIRDEKGRQWASWEFFEEGERTSPV